MFSIIQMNLRVLVRDKANMFLLLIFPTILVFLLGNLLANMDNPDDIIDPMVVEYKVETKEQAELTAIDSFINGLSDNNDIKMKEVTDGEIAAKKASDGKISSYILFSDASEIVIHEGMDSTQNRAVNIIMNSFSGYTAAYLTLSENNPAKLPEIPSVYDTENVEEKDFGYERTMLDYYAVAMIVMILFMGGAIGGSSSIYDGRQNGTFRRMVISPRSRANIYFQTILGSLPQTLIQVVAIMIPSVLLFGANYAQNAGDNLILIIMFTMVGIAVNAVFTIVGIFVKNNPTMVIMPILWVIMFISGTFSKEIYVEGITELSPIWLIQNASFQLTIFQNHTPSLIIIGICAVTTVVATAIGASQFSRKEVIL